MMSVVSVTHLGFVVKNHFWSKSTPILRDVHFDVQPREILGFIGPNGAGKTTCIKTLLGLLRPTSGQVFLFGQSPQKPQAREAVGFMPERAYYAGHLSARELLLQHALLAGLSWQRATKQSVELLERVGLAQAGNKPLRNFSKGMLQRAGIGQALVGDPQLLILDEPMSGLDPIGRHDLRELLLQLKRDGKTIIFSSHILSDVEALCDRLTVVVQGRTAMSGKLSELLTSKVQSVTVVAENLSVESLTKLTSWGVSRPLDQQFTWTCANHVESNALMDQVRSLGGTIVELQTQHRSLEEIFMHAASAQQGDKHA